MSDRRKAESALYEAADRLHRVDEAIGDALGHIASEGCVDNAPLVEQLTRDREELTRIRARIDAAEVLS